MIWPPRRSFSQAMLCVLDGSQPFHTLIGASIACSLYMPDYSPPQYSRHMVTVDDGLAVG